jgi:hypothetical protein
LASKKGIAITAAIAAATVGSSFLIWFIPQSSPGSLRDSPRANEEIISDVYSRHQSLAADVESKFKQWRSGNMTSADMQSQLNLDRSYIQNMREQLVSASSAQGWQESYNSYIQALDSYLDYLDLMQTRVENEDKLNSDLELDELKQKWEGYVNGSINAMPL